jgi:hypothetical protein
MAKDLGPGKSINLDPDQLKSAVFEVMKKAAVDSEFRELALRDGNAAITKADQRFAPLSEIVKVTFLDKSHHALKRMEMTVVLTDPRAETDEIPLAELENVAGGISSGLVKMLGPSSNTRG